MAVAPKASYAKVRSGDETFLLAEERVRAVLGEEAEVLELLSGAELAERYESYEGPLFELADRPPGP